jgi:hypothetical protein
MAFPKCSVIHQLKHPDLVTVPDSWNLLFRCEIAPCRRYPYFDVVAGLAWSEDSESYAGSSIATGWGSHAGQIKGDDPDKKGYPGPPGWGLGMCWQPHPVKLGFVLKPQLNPGKRKKVGRPWPENGLKCHRRRCEITGKILKKNFLAFENCWRFHCRRN